MEDRSTSRTTALLEASESGDEVSIRRLLPIVYEELRGMAHRQLVRERDSHTLNTTALVHEAYLKLVDHSIVTRRGRSYFFAAAARAMRQVLVDYARRSKAAKRGGDRKPLRLEHVHLGVGAFATDLIDLDSALDRLSELNPRQAQVVECRYFGGLSVRETAAALDVSVRTVKYDWALARSWLYDELRT